jgi:hypothetical protein
MSDDDKVGYGKPPAKTRFQKGKSGNPSGRPKRRNPPKEPLDFQKELVAELKSPMTLKEAGNKKRMPKLRALLKAAVARAFHDKAIMKNVLNLAAKLPKEAFVEGEVYTYRVTQATLDLWDKIEQDAATWSANSSEGSTDEEDCANLANGSILSCRRSPARTASLSLDPTRRSRGTSETS